MVVGNTKGFIRGKALSVEGHTHSASQISGLDDYIDSNVGFKFAEYTSNLNIRFTGMFCQYDHDRNSYFYTQPNSTSVQSSTCDQVEINVRGTITLTKSSDDGNAGTITIISTNIILFSNTSIRASYSISGNGTNRITLTFNNQICKSYPSSLTGFPTYSRYTIGNSLVMTAHTNNVANTTEVYYDGSGTLQVQIKYKMPTVSV